MFINILYYWIYMETRTKYGFGSFKNLDQGEYEITEIKTKPAEVQYVYKHKGGFDYHEEKKVFQITILNADYHDYCYVLPASPSSFR